MNRIIKRILISLGIFFMVLVLLSLTEQPFWAYYWLGTHNSKLGETPDYIVVMGAGGMPAPEGLIRCYYAAQAANNFPQAKVIIALPTLEKYLETSHTYAMYREIKNRGVDSTRFLFEISGINTRTQALAISDMIEEKDSIALLIVTSPDHMLRSVLAFRNVGFSLVGGIPTFRQDIDEDLLWDKNEFKKQIREPQENVLLRYNMWNYLVYEVLVIREVIALTYYKIRGWI